MVILCIDLAKAYDTMKHGLLFLILDKYGIPRELINIIKLIYPNCEIEIAVGKEGTTLNCITSVQHGDTVVLVLFLFILIAVSQTLKGKWNFKTP
jgi:hypothetical protein